MPAVFVHSQKYLNGTDCTSLSSRKSAPCQHVTRWNYAHLWVKSTDEGLYPPARLLSGHVGTVEANFSTLALDKRLNRHVDYFHAGFTVCACAPCWPIPYKEVVGCVTQTLQIFITNTDVGCIGPNTTVFSNENRLISSKILYKNVCNVLCMQNEQARVLLFVPQEVVKSLVRLAVHSIWSSYVIFFSNWSCWSCMDQLENFIELHIRS